MIRDLAPAIPVAEVHRLLGYPIGFVVPPRIASRLEACLSQAKPLVEARGVYEHLSLSEAAAVALPLPGAASALGGFALGLVTIGPGIETLIASSARDGDFTGALLLDAIGSAAAEAATDALGSLIAAPHNTKEPSWTQRSEIAAQTSDAPPCRVSPGYGGWPLSAQEAVFSRLPHAALGVSLLPSMLMIPKKSVTFAIWFDPAGRAVTSPGGCSRCALERCPRRLAGLEGDSA